MKKLLFILLCFSCRTGYADSKISAMSSTTTLNAGDVIPIVANPSGSATNHIITKTNLITTLGIAGAGYALQPATVTIQAAQGITVSSAITISLPTVITSTLTMTSTMSVVLASAPANSAYITLTLPSAASSPGVDLMIYKVDATTGQIRIVPQSGELIESTGTILLNAKFQHASLHSLGTTGWGSGLGGIQYTPHAFATSQDEVGTYTASVSSVVYQCPIYVPLPVAVLGFRATKAAGGGNISFGLFDPSGNSIVSLSTQAFSAILSNYLLPTPYQLSGGWYKLAVQLSNTSVATTGSNTVNDLTMLCSEGATPTDMDLSKVTLTTGGARNRNIPALNMIVNGGQLEN